MKNIFIIIYLILIPLTPYINASLAYEVISDDVIMYNGVTHIKSKSKVTNDANSTSNQRVNVFKKESDILAVNWSKFNNGKLLFANVLNIAKDFELINPEYEVIAGVNGDFFWPPTTISSNVIFNDSVIKTQNHEKYYSVTFDNYGNFIEENRRLTVSDKLSLSLLNSKNSLLFYQEIDYINKKVLYEDDLTVLFIEANQEIPIDSNARYYQLAEINKNLVGSDLFFEGIVVKESNVLSEGVYLASKNSEINDLIKNGYKIKVQNVIKNLNFGEMVIGVDQKILDNNHIKSFGEMEGQSEDYNRYRHPRTGFGFDEDGNMILITVDGRQQNISEGVNLREFGKIMQDYGIINGYNLDGGGSTQAIFKNNGSLEIVNQPSESLRSVGNAILFVRRKSNLKPTVLISDNKIDISLNQQTLYSNVYLNGVLTKYEGEQEELSIDINSYMDYTLSIETAYLEGGNEIIENVYNNYIKKSATKPKIIPDVSISYIYENTTLKINVDFEDVDLMIDRIRVYLSNPELNTPALTVHSGRRQATFNSFEFAEQTIIVEVTYKDQTVKTFNYELFSEEIKDNDTDNDNNNNDDNVNENNIKYYIYGGVITIVLGIGFFWFFKKIKPKL